MAKRPTIADLAHAAGVSEATVDRVLNARGKVRPETAHSVLDAAERIGYHAAALIGHRLQPSLPTLRVGFVLQKGRQAFWQAFGTAAQEAAKRAIGVSARAEIVFLSSQAPSDVASALIDLKDKVDAVAAVAVAHDGVTAAVGELQAAGVPCLALLNDYAQGVRNSYIGLNNLKVGRVAAHMIATTRPVPGKVAVFVGGFRWHGHALRETGFRSYFREFSPNSQVLDTLVNLETRQLTYEATLDLLDRHPDLTGLYVAGGGMEGAISALRETREPGEVTLIVNELTPDSRAALTDRYAALVIATPLDAVCSYAFEFAATARAHGESAIPSQHFLLPELILPEVL